jgi:hypothetical protein
VFRREGEGFISHTAKRPIKTVYLDEEGSCYSIPNSHGLFDDRDLPALSPNASRPMSKARPDARPAGEHFRQNLSPAESLRCTWQKA